MKSKAEADLNTAFAFEPDVKICCRPFAISCQHPRRASTVQLEYPFSILCIRIVHTHACLSLSGRSSQWSCEVQMQTRLCFWVRRGTTGRVVIATARFLVTTSLTTQLQAMQSSHVLSTKRTRPYVPRHPDSGKRGKSPGNMSQICMETSL